MEDALTAGKGLGEDRTNGAAGEGRASDKRVREKGKVFFIREKGKVYDRKMIKLLSSTITKI